MVRKTVLSAALMSAVLGFGSFGFADEKPAAGGAHAHKDDHKHEHGEVEGVDRKDPKSVAKAVLTAYKNKDLKTLAKLAPEDAAAMINEIAEKAKPTNAIRASSPAGAGMRCRSGTARRSKPATSCTATTTTPS